jgi:hypothetical protein
LACVLGERALAGVRVKRLRELRGLGTVVPGTRSPNTGVVHGQRFYVSQTPTTPQPPPVTHINLILNWPEELKARVPVR